MRRNDEPGPQAGIPMKIVFAGTPEFSVPVLQVLLDSPHEVVAVSCAPAR